MSISTACPTDEAAVADLADWGPGHRRVRVRTVLADLAVTGEQILFLGDAASSGMQATDTVRLRTWSLCRGSSTCTRTLNWMRIRSGRTCVFHQGITTVGLGVDGGGGSDVASRLEGWLRMAWCKRLLVRRT
ncbi:MAG: hypothetical protein CM1200mP14_17450 [Gammaproteobacteria bacterium]|nr:MAG: hypothetical protein CM1200mP14_17450 [Gammaproteobacteria bacterium]